MSSSFDLPPLYFASRGQSFSCIDDTPNNSENASDKDDDNRGSSVCCLSAEVLHHCLTTYADYGDLAKLALVQRDWSLILSDAVALSARHQWELACAWAQGARGLPRDTARAIYWWRHLIVTHEPRVRVVATSEDDDKVISPVYDSTTAAKEDSCWGNEYATKAMKKLGFLFLDGGSVEAGSFKNKTVGMQWLECAHLIGGDMDAAHEMALIYEYGRYGVETDPVVAFTWFQKAAHAGHVEGMAELALCYELGCGVAVDDEQALDWYMKAAEAGHVTAKYSVGECFEEARGVPQSDSEACLWYYKAAVAGCEDSRRALQRLEDIARIVVPGVRAFLLDG